ncbi:MAG: GNAT family N-acetyltransferase [Pseudomonadota bacterium]
MRPLCDSDITRIAELGGEWDVASMTSRMSYPYSQEAAAQWLHDQADGEFVRGITLDGLLIGICGYLPDGKGVAEIGYWIGKPFWGQGFATEAARAMVDHAFRTGSFHALTCGHFNDNPASQRVIEKLGFSVVGPCACWCQAQGRNVDAVRYRLARPSLWQTLKAPIETAFRRAS